MAEVWVHWRPIIEEMYKADEENEVLWRINLEVKLDGQEVNDFLKLEREIEDKGISDWRILGPSPGWTWRRRATNHLY